jgi:hypothetical protein
MTLRQISVFLENHPGQISHACRTLADADINITSLSLADTGQFGVLRLLIRDHDRALAALSAGGFVAKLTEVVAIDVSDRPGGLADVLESIEAVGINIEYIYAFTYRSAERAVIIFRFADPDRAVEVLRANGFHVLDGDELSRRVEETAAP